MVFVGETKSDEMTSHGRTVTMVQNVTAALLTVRRRRYLSYNTATQGKREMCRASDQMNEILKSVVKSFLSSSNTHINKKMSQ